MDTKAASSSSTPQKNSQYFIPNWNEEKQQIVEDNKGELQSRKGKGAIISIDCTTLNATLRKELGIDRRRINVNPSMLGPQIKFLKELCDSGITIDQESDSSYLVTFAQGHFSEINFVFNNWKILKNFSFTQFQVVQIYIDSILNDAPLILCIYANDALIDIPNQTKLQLGRYWALQNIKAIPECLTLDKLGNTVTTSQFESLASAYISYAKSTPKFQDRNKQCETYGKLIKAIYENNKNAFFKIAQSGFNINKVFLQDINILTIIMQSTNVPAFHYCIKHGYPIDTPNNNGFTPIMLAAGFLVQCMKKKPALIKIFEVFFMTLLRRGADLDRTTHSGINIETIFADLPPNAECVKTNIAIERTMFHQYTLSNTNQAVIAYVKQLGGKIEGKQLTIHTKLLTSEARKHLGLSCNMITVENKIIFNILDRKLQAKFADRITIETNYIGNNQHTHIMSYDKTLEPQVDDFLNYWRGLSFNEFTFPNERVTNALYQKLQAKFADRITIETNYIGNNQHTYIISYDKTLEPQVDDILNYWSKLSFNGVTVPSGSFANVLRQNLQAKFVDHITMEADYSENGQHTYIMSYDKTWEPQVNNFLNYWSKLSFGETTVPNKSIANILRQKLQAEFANRITMEADDTENNQNTYVITFNKTMKSQAADFFKRWERLTHKKITVRNERLVNIFRQKLQAKFADHITIDADYIKNNQHTYIISYDKTWEAQVNDFLNNWNGTTFYEITLPSESIVNILRQKLQAKFADRITVETDYIKNNQHTCIMSYDKTLMTQVDDFCKYWDRLRFYKVTLLCGSIANVNVLRQRLQAKFAVRVTMETDYIENNQHTYIMSYGKTLNPQVSDFIKHWNELAHKEITGLNESGTIVLRHDLQAKFGDRVTMEADDTEHCKNTYIISCDKTLNPQVSDFLKHWKQQPGATALDVPMMNVIFSQLRQMQVLTPFTQMPTATYPEAFSPSANIKVPRQMSVAAVIPSPYPQPMPTMPIHSAVPMSTATHQGDLSPSSSTKPVPRQMSVAAVIQSPYPQPMPIHSAVPTSTATHQGDLSPSSSTKPVQRQMSVAAVTPSPYPQPMPTHSAATPSHYPQPMPMLSATLMSTATHQGYLSPSSIIAPLPFLDCNSPLLSSTICCFSSFQLGIKYWLFFCGVLLLLAAFVSII